MEKLANAGIGGALKAITGETVKLIAAAEAAAKEERKKIAAQRTEKIRKSREKLAKLPDGLHEVLPTAEGEATLSRAVKSGARMIGEKPELDSAAVETLKKTFDGVKGAMFHQEVGDTRADYALTLDKPWGKESWHLSDTSLGFLTFTNASNPKLKAYVDASADSSIILKVIDTEYKEALDRNKRAVAPDVLAKLKTELGKALREVDERGYKHALMIQWPDGKSEAWYLNRTEKGGAHFVSKSDPDRVFWADAPLKSAQMMQTIAKMREDAESEKADAAEAKKFDLPKDRPIGYIGVHGMGDKQNRKDFKEPLQLNDAFPEMLARCGYRMVCVDGRKNCEPLTAHPQVQLKQQVEELYKKGVRDFYINLDAHGSKNGVMIYWEDKDGKGWQQEMQASQLKAIVAEYYDCKFTINTDACHGGGMIGIMRDFQDWQGAKPGRVNVIPHCKEEHLNWDYYDMVLTKQLADMANGVEGAAKTYGEAHLRADKATRKVETPRGYNDAEFWKSLPAQPSRRTAQNDPAKPDAAIANAAKQYHSGYEPERRADPVEPRHNLPKMIAHRVPTV